MTTDGGRRPGRLAYVTLLGTTTMGTLSSNIVSAPLHAIAADLGATSREVVLTVSAFTIAMVLFAPVAGWACDRLGARRFLVASLLFMIAVQLGASASPNLGFLVVMRVGQGIACSAVPPAVQQMLGRGWAGSRARVMGAWASAIGVGQAVGPPLGGLTADLLGWRAIFVVYAALCAVFVACLVLVTPPSPPRRATLHGPGTASLVAGAGGLVTAATTAGQGGPPALVAALGGLGVLSIALAWRLARRHPVRFLDPDLLVERRFLRSTTSAGAVMAVLGIVIVTVPLHLGREVGLAPGPIGAVMFTLAVSMALFAPISSRIGERITARRMLLAGLAALTLAPLTLAASGAVARPGIGVAPVVLALVFVGCAIGAVQSTAAFALARSPAAGTGAALGLHNMVRFSGLAVGYAWAAGTFPLGRLWAVYAGASAMALVALLTAAGPPAAPVGELAP